MAYGTKLKSKTVYKRIFNSTKRKIKSVYKQAVIEHVGGTSLSKPTGKGDIDIYVLYETKNRLRALQSILTKLFGKPGKITSNRVRYNFVVNGIEVEIQLIDKNNFGKATALRDYLNAYPAIAKKYASHIMRLRTQFLADMYKIKSDFTKKASGKIKAG